MNLQTFETKRLMLRPFSVQDAKRVQELAGAPEVAATTLNIPHPYKDGMAENWINQLDFILAITQIDTRKLIGCINLSLNLHHHKAELGYWIGKFYWNQGYCTEAAQRMIKFGFKELKLNKITSRHISSNPASGKVMKKIGMIEEGFLKQELFKNNTFHDLIVFGLLKENYDLEKAS